MDDLPVAAIDKRSRASAHMHAAADLWYLRVLSLQASTSTASRSIHVRLLLLILLVVLPVHDIVLVAYESTHT